MEASVFCNLILEIIYHSFCHTLVPLTKWNTMWINKSLNIRRWQSLEMILKSDYNGEERVPKQQNLLEIRGKEDAVGSKLDQKWLSTFTPGQDERTRFIFPCGKKKKSIWNKGFKTWGKRQWFLRDKKQMRGVLGLPRVLSGESFQGMSQKEEPRQTPTVIQTQEDGAERLGRAKWLEFAGQSNEKERVHRGTAPEIFRGSSLKKVPFLLFSWVLVIHVWKLSKAEEITNWKDKK